MSQNATPPGSTATKRKKLGEDDDNPETNLLSQNPFASLAGNTALQGQGTNPSTTPSDQKSSKNKQPPLVVRNVEFSTITQSVAKTGASAIFKITRFGTKILCNSAEDFSLVEKHLQAANMEYYTHDKPNDRPFKVVIRGLPMADPKEVSSCLLTECGLEALNVHIIKRSKEVTTQNDAIYLVHFPKGYTTLKKLREVKAVANIIIRWEAYRNNRSEVTQCMNCLHYGHGTKNCHLKSRCNNCGAAHITENCPTKSAPTSRCANCRGSHPATDRSCSKRAEYIKIRQEVTTANQPGRKPVKKTPQAPKLTEDQFPSLPPSLEMQSGNPAVGSRSNVKSHIDPRVRAASYAAQANSTPVESGANLYNSAQLWSIFNELCSRLQQCKTRADQIRVLGYMVCYYGVN